MTYKLIKLLVAYPWRCAGIFFVCYWFIPGSTELPSSFKSASLGKVALTAPFLLSYIWLFAGLVAGGIMWRSAKTISRCRRPSRFILGLVVLFMGYTLAVSWGVPAVIGNLTAHVTQLKPGVDKQGLMSRLEARLEDPEISGEVKSKVASILYHLSGEQYTYILADGTKVRYELTDEDRAYQEAVSDIEGLLKSFWESALFLTVLYGVLMVLAWVVVRMTNLNDKLKRF